MAALAIMTTLAALVGFVTDGGDVVRTERVELLNPKGAVQAALTVDTSGAVLTLYDKRGHATGSLRLNAVPRLSVLDGSGREQAGLGAPRVQHLAQ